MDSVKSEDDIQYWKDKANEFMQKYNAEREDFLEYQSNSRELELELEGQLSALEKENKALAFRNDQILDEFTQYKESAESKIVEFKQHNDNQEKIISKLKEEIENSHRRIRFLEQQNDDLERAYRNATVSLDDFENKLNSELEKNAILENELDEKENLHIIIQRLKDETRDLQQELIARQKKNKIDVENNHKENITREDQYVNVAESPSKKPTNLSLSPNAKFLLSQRSIGGENLPPSVRFAALNLVNELLKKVGTIENKMGALYNFYGPQCDENVL